MFYSVLKYYYSNVLRTCMSCVCLQLDHVTGLLQTTVEELLMLGIEIGKTVDGVVSGQLEHTDHSSFG